MIIPNASTVKLFISDYSKKNGALQSSMSRLASGDRLSVIGTDPANLGISENFRAQIRGTAEASKVTQNAVNLFQTADSVFGEVQSMLDRMLELSVSANDGSKRSEDLKNLDLEFQALKEEIGRSAEGVKYNGLQIGTSTSVGMYDFVDKTIKYVQSDGSAMKDIGINLVSGNTSRNNVEYRFVNTDNDEVAAFTFANGGKQIAYLMQGTSEDDTVQLARLDIESDTVLTSSSVALTESANTNLGDHLDLNQQIKFVTDDSGDVWFSDITENAATTAGEASAAVLYTITKLNVGSWTTDAGGTDSTNSWTGEITQAVSSNFSIHDGYAYYFKGNDTAAEDVTRVDFVKQNIYDPNDTKVLLADVGDSSGGLGFALDLEDDLISVSQDGQYLAIVKGSDLGTINLYDTSNGKYSSVSVGTDANSVASLNFDRNGNIIWSDTGDEDNANSIFKAKVNFGDTPTLGTPERLISNTAGHFGVAAGGSVLGLGMSVSGVSPQKNFDFQLGPDSGMKLEFETGNIDLVSLGISRLKLDTPESAQKALDALPSAILKVSNIRSKIGAQVSRLDHISAGLESFYNNISQAESRLRDVDFAEETAKMSSNQIAMQAALRMLTTSNQVSQAVLSLLQ